MTRDIVRELVRKQMLKAIEYCSLKKTYCKYSSGSYCLIVRECPYLKMKENSFERRKK